MDPTHKVCNERLADMLGTTVEEWRTLENFRDTFVEVADRAWYCDTYERVVHKLDWPDTYQFRATRKDGTSFDAEATIVPITFAGRRLAYHFVRPLKERAGSTPDARTTVRRFHDAWNDHDVERVMALMTQDCVFESTWPPPEGGASRDTRPSGGSGNVSSRSPRKPTSTSRSSLPMGSAPRCAGATGGATRSASTSAVSTCTSSTADAVAVLARLRARLASLEAAEVCYADGLDLVTAHTGLPPPLRTAAPCVLLVECAAHRDPTDELAAAIGDVPEVRDTVVATDRAGRAALWAYRERHTEAVAALGVAHKLDVSVPLGALARFEPAVRRRIALAAPGAHTVLGATSATAACT